MRTIQIPHWVWLLIILLFAFVTRLYRLSYPPTYVFDEVYHALTAKLIAHNDPIAYEWTHEAPEPNTAIDWLHPPLAKYTQALSMLVFGENSFGWRFSSVVFGVGVIALVYMVTQVAFQERQLSLLATMIAALDGLLLVQSRIAMNDIHVTFFILLAIYLYLLYRKKNVPRYLLFSGLASGLAMASKWSGVFVVATIILLEAGELLQALRKNRPARELKQKFVTAIISLFIIPPIVYVLGYSHMFLQGKGLDHFYALHQQIWAYQTHLTATHPYQSRPLQWFFDVRPVWYYVEYSKQETVANIYAFGNPFIFWFGAIASITSYLYLLSKRLTRKLTDQDRRLFVILLLYGMTWLPWVLSPRIMFFYHYTPAVPLLSILLAYWLFKLWHLPNRDEASWGQVIVSMAIMLIVSGFVIWYPNWTALPVSAEFAKNIYFMFDTWK